MTREGQASCLRGSVGGGGSMDCSPVATGGAGEYMGPGADLWIDGMVGHDLVGLFLFSSEKWVAQSLRCMSLGEWCQKFEEKGEMEQFI